MSITIFQRQIFILSYIQEQNRQGRFPDRKKIHDKIDEKFDEIISDNTLDRDIKFLREEVGVDLKFSRSKNGYEILNITEIDNSFIADFSRSMTILLAQNSKTILPETVIYESRNLLGTDYFSNALKACENYFECEISYFNYDSLEEKKFEIQPYKLKLKDFRWYLLAKDKNAPEVPFKSFAMERVKNFKTLKTNFTPENIDFEQPFEHAFGMFTSYQNKDGKYTEKTPVKLVIQLDKRDGNYVRANPIHHSQKVLKEDETTITFELFILPTLDLIKELLSRSWSIKIVEPDHLRKQFLDYWQKAIERNT